MPARIKIKTRRQSSIDEMATRADDAKKAQRRRELDMAEKAYWEKKASERRALNELVTRENKEKKRRRNQLMVKKTKTRI